LLRNLAEIKMVLYTNEQARTVENEDDEYMIFTFFEKDLGMQLEFAGWARLETQPEKPGYVKGVVNTWGCSIPVIDLRAPNAMAATETTDAACIVIFEQPEQYKHYFGMVVEEVSNVIDIVDGSENRRSPLLVSARRHLSTDAATDN
jgi:chemotaxis signal transduction protein